MIKVKTTGEFDKKLENLSLDNKEIERIVSEKMELFRNNPQDTRLRNHALKKRMKGRWAFSITLDIRIVYEWLGENTVRFLTIGNHKDVYGKYAQKC